MTKLKSILAIVFVAALLSGVAFAESMDSGASNPSGTMTNPSGNMNTPGGTMNTPGMENTPGTMNPGGNPGGGY